MTAPAKAELTRLLSGGGLVIFPTDTLYGLGGDPSNPNAVRRILEIKGGAPRPFPLLAANLQSILEVAHPSVHPVIRKLGAVFWPGGLTVVVPLRDEAIERLELVSLHGTAGFRIPDSEPAREVAAACGGLVIGTSANRAGRPPPSSAEQISTEMKALVDLDWTVPEPCRGEASTLVRLGGERPEILRVGAIPSKRILAILEA